jgi:hypothetical protein
MRVMGFHGIDPDVWNRNTSQTAMWEYNIVEAGQV